MNRRQLLRRLCDGAVRNVAFGDMQSLVEAFGFRLARVSASHHIFVHAAMPELVNLQGGAMSHYHINIFYSAEDGGYIADIPDLDACSAFGRTPDEALAEVEKAKTAWIAAARQAGKPVPEPRYRPAIYQASR